MTTLYQCPGACSLAPLVALHFAKLASKLGLNDFLAGLELTAVDAYFFTVLCRTDMFKIDLLPWPTWPNQKRALKRTQPEHCRKRR